MISIIVPVLDEVRALPAALDSVFGQKGDYEIIVVDGGSMDGTRQLAESYPRVTCVSSDTGRAVQMNAGARLASGEWLLFLHADTRLPDGALERLNGLERDPKTLAGGFRHRFSENRWALRLISWLNNKRCRRTRVFYGDQAPFVRRKLFEELGGYPEEPSLEDVLFAEKLKCVTRPVLLEQAAVTDSRRFTEQGPWRSLARVFLILSCHRLGLPVPASKFFAPVR